MKRTFTYNFVEKTIVGSKAAIERANRGLNPEYAELTEMLAAHPEFKVSVKNIQKKEGKKTYNRLTFDRMREYIETQFSNKEELNEKLAELEAIKAIAKAKKAMYPFTKKWFLNTYPEFKENEVSETERAELQKAITEEQKARAAAALAALEEAA